MAFFVYSRASGINVSKPPRLLLVGGDGRWVQPFLRLTQHLGFAPLWLERRRLEMPDPEQFQQQDIVMVADPGLTRWVAERWRSKPLTPIVVITGSLMGLSTSLTRDALPLSWPITKENLEDVLRTIEESAG
ncbi:MAG: hypothetical protein KTR25_06405 [Myxococcales bacterium]|nr:hypothetical protein [Myxococcales bacterium]